MSDQQQQKKAKTAETEIWVSYQLQDGDYYTKEFCSQPDFVAWLFGGEGNQIVFSALGFWIRRYPESQCKYHIKNSKDYKFAPITPSNVVEVIVRDPDENSVEKTVPGFTKEEDFKDWLYGAGYPYISKSKYVAIYRQKEKPKDTTSVFARGIKKQMVREVLELDDYVDWLETEALDGLIPRPGNEQRRKVLREEFYDDDAVLCSKQFGPEERKLLGDAVAIMNKKNAEADCQLDHAFWNNNHEFVIRLSKK